jgi:hypothetical protein
LENCKRREAGGRKADAREKLQSMKHKEREILEQF